MRYGCNTWIIKHYPLRNSSYLTGSDYYAIQKSGGKNLNQKLYKIVSIILCTAILGLFSLKGINFLTEITQGSYIFLIPAVLLFLYFGILPLGLAILHLAGIRKLPERPLSSNPLLQNQRWGRGYCDIRYPDEEVKNQWIFNFFLLRRRNTPMLASGMKAKSKVSADLSANWRSRIISPPVGGSPWYSRAKLWGWVH